MCGSRLSSSSSSSRAVGEPSSDSAPSEDSACVNEDSVSSVSKVVDGVPSLLMAAGKGFVNVNIGFLRENADPPLRAALDVRLVRIDISIILGLTETTQHKLV